MDEQRRGPYRFRVHEHRFEERAGRTLASDRVRYAAPGGWLVDRLLVRPDLERVFEYRRTVLRRVFGPADRSGNTAGRGRLT